MSRYKDWTNTLDNIINRIIDNEGLNANKATIKSKKLVLGYAKQFNFKGTYTEKVLFVRSRFGHFVKNYNLNRNS